MGTNSIYRSPDAKLTIEGLYWRAVDRLEGEYDVDLESAWVDTRFGRTHLLVAGPEDAPPLVVFHGGNVTNPITLEWLLPLAEEYRLYAPDTIGHPGLSAETRLSPSDGSYGEWVVDLLDGLGLESASMIGISYGGGVLLRTAIVSPDRIDAAVLAVPTGLETGSVRRLVVELALPMLAYRLAPSQRRLERAVQPLFTEPASEVDPDIRRLIGTVFRGVRLEREFPAKATAAELAAFDAPTYVILAENDVLLPPEAVGPRAREVLPNLVGEAVLENESHFPSERGRERLLERTRAFLAEYVR